MKNPRTLLGREDAQGLGDLLEHLERRKVQRETLPLILQAVKRRESLKREDLAAVHPVLMMESQRKKDQERTEGVKDPGQKAKIKDQKSLKNALKKNPVQRILQVT